MTGSGGRRHFFLCHSVLPEARLAAAELAEGQHDVDDGAEDGTEEHWHSDGDDQGDQIEAVVEAVPH